MKSSDKTLENIIWQAVSAAKRHKVDYIIQQSAGKYSFTRKPQKKTVYELLLIYKKNGITIKGSTGKKIDFSATVIPKKEKAVEAKSEPVKVQSEPDGGTTEG